MVEKDSSTLKSETAMSANHRVLLIEDDEANQQSWKRFLEIHQIEVLAALDLEEADLLFENFKESISVISVDGCVPGSELNTRPLIRKMRRGFSGPIIAASGDSFYRKQMMEVGCTHECLRKSDLPRMILELLDSLKSSAA